MKCLILLFVASVSAEYVFLNPFSFDFRRPNPGRKTLLRFERLKVKTYDSELGKGKNNSSAVDQPLWKKEACVSDGVKGNFYCDSNGDLKCMNGWQGDLCNVPICKKGCDPLQGYCKAPGECRCKFGFYGAKCNKCITLLGCQHGYCNQSFECICNKGWDGLFCSEPICREDCHATRGYCESPNECRCRIGWSGPTCKSCQPLPGCQHGYCDNPLECKCHPGYTGLLCQSPICSAECSSDHGYCRRPGECRCKVGWTGRNCLQCHPYPGCVHGTCNRPWECNCKSGWGGMLCDEALDYCDKNVDVCKNGGTCQSLEAGDGHFRCSCPDGVSGKHCEKLALNTTNAETESSTEAINDNTTNDVLDSISNENATNSIEKPTNTSENSTSEDDTITTTESDVSTEVSVTDSSKDDRSLKRNNQKGLGNTSDRFKHSLLYSMATAIKRQLNVGSEHGQR